MHKLRRIVALAAFSLCVAGQASAAASALVQIKGLGDTGTRASGVDFITHGYDIVLSPGETYEVWWHYTITVADDGRTAQRTWVECPPLEDGYCGPVPNGFEQAEAWLYPYVLAADPDVELTVLGDAPGALATLADGQPQSQKKKGKFGYRWTNTLPEQSVRTQFGLTVVTFVDASQGPRWSVR